MGLAIGLFLPFIFLYFIYLFDLAIDNHYDVKKGTFLWYAQMDNKTITKFPLITPIGKEKFNAIGGDSPSISTGWEIEYWSGKELNEISEKINKHLKKDGFELQEVEKEELVSSYYIESENYAVEQFYIGSNKKGESLELLIQQTAKPETKITCKIYY